MSLLPEAIEHRSRLRIFRILSGKKLPAALCFCFRSDRLLSLHTRLRFTDAFRLVAVAKLKPSGLQLTPIAADRLCGKQTSTFEVSGFRDPSKPTLSLVPRLKGFRQICDLRHRKLGANCVANWRLLLERRRMSVRICRCLHLNCLTSGVWLPRSGPD